MHGIILCSLILFVVICYSNGAPVGHRKDQSKEKKSHATHNKKKHPKKTVDTSKLDSHVTESKPMDASHQKRCKCKPKHSIEVKSHAETHACKRDCCYPCCCHPCPTQHQKEDCDSGGGGGGGGGGGAGEERVKRSKSKSKSTSIPPQCRPFLVGEMGCGCGWQQSLQHLGPCDWHDTDCCSTFGCPCDHVTRNNGSECDPFPSMKAVTMGNGDVCLGLPHPCLQLFGPPKKPKPPKFIPPVPFAGCKPDDNCTCFRPPSCDIICVNGHKVMGLPYPAQQIDHGNDTSCHGDGGYSCHGCGYQSGCAGDEFLMYGDYHPCSCGEHGYHSYGGNCGYGGGGGNCGCGCTSCGYGTMGGINLGEIPNNGQTYLSLPPPHNSCCSPCGYSTYSCSPDGSSSNYDSYEHCEY